MYHMSADAEQIQYRIFAHQAQNPQVLEEYRKNPNLSFHKMMWANLKPFKPDLSYKRTKDVNFANIFAAGPTKLAFMLEFITKKEFLELKMMKAKSSHPKLATTMEILKIYRKVLPEGQKLIDEASKIALDRGYIKSILGRRMRFPDGQRLHKALNGRIIMSEADIVKTKGVELHKNRKYTNLKLRFQVHDEYDGDVPDEESRRRVEEILNAQSFKLSVPILWKAKIGKSWGDTAAEELAQIRAEMHL